LPLIQTDFLLLISAIVAMGFSAIAFGMAREAGLRLKWNWLCTAFVCWAAQAACLAVYGGESPSWLPWLIRCGNVLFLYCILDCCRRSRPTFRQSRATLIVLILVIVALLVWLCYEPRHAAWPYVVTLLSLCVFPAIGWQVYCSQSGIGGKRGLVATLALGLGIWPLFCLAGGIWLQDFAASTGGRISEAGIYLGGGAGLFLPLLLGGVSLSRRWSQRLEDQAWYRLSLLRFIVVLVSIIGSIAAGGMLTAYLTRVSYAEVILEADRRDSLLMRRLTDAGQLLQDLVRLIARSPALQERGKNDETGNHEAVVELLTRLYSSGPVLSPDAPSVAVLAARQDADYLDIDFQQYENVFLVRDDGMIFLSSRPEMLRHYLWSAGSELASTTRPSDSRYRWYNGAIMEWDGTLSLVSRTSLSTPGWSLVSLQSLEPVQRARGLGLALTAAAACAAIGVGVVLRLLQESKFAVAEHHEVEHTLAAMEKVLAAMAHDLRTPLTSIRALAEYRTIAQPPLPDDVIRDLNTIVRQTERMTTLTNSTLDAVRLRMTDSQPQHWGTVDMVAIVENAVRTIKPLLNGAEVSIRSAVAPGLGMNGDSVALQRLVMNLLSNAQRHTEHGRIDVSASLVQRGEHTWMIVSVSDTGPGITDQKLPFLGKPFALGGERAIRGTSRGIGLGLTIARDICEAHGGVLSVQTKVGEGTIFTAELRADLPKPLPVQGLRPIQLNS